MNPKEFLGKGLKWLHEITQPVDMTTKATRETRRAFAEGRPLPNALGVDGHRDYAQTEGVARATAPPAAPEPAAESSPYERPVEEVVMTGPRPLGELRGVFLHEDLAALVAAKPQARRIFTVEDEVAISRLRLPDGIVGRPGHYEHGMLGQPLYVGAGHVYRGRSYAETWNRQYPDDQIEIVALDEMLLGRDV